MLTLLVDCPSPALASLATANCSTRFAENLCLERQATTSSPADWSAAMASPPAVRPPAADTKASRRYPKSPDATNACTLSFNPSYPAMSGCEEALSAMLCWP